MKLLNEHPKDPELLLALARLLRADNQLSQARRYLMAAGKSLQTGASLNDKADELRQLIAGELGQLVCNTSMERRNYRRIELKNSSLVLVSLSLSKMNSMAAISSISCSNLRNIQTRCISSSDINNSSRRVADRRILIAG